MINITKILCCDLCGASTEIKEDLNPGDRYKPNLPATWRRFTIMSGHQTELEFGNMPTFFSFFDACESCSKKAIDEQARLAKEKPTAEGEILVPNGIKASFFKDIFEKKIRPKL